MPVSRLCGGSVSMRCSPRRMRPSSSSQNPATMRSSVVFPQPDGPSRVKNSPSPTAIETSSTARTPEKLRTTPSIVSVATPASLLQTSARPPDDVLDLLGDFSALLHPGVLVIIDELDVGELRHLPGQL